MAPSKWMPLHSCVPCNAVAFISVSIVSSTEMFLWGGGGVTGNNKDFPFSEVPVDCFAKNRGKIFQMICREMQVHVPPSDAQENRRGGGGGAKMQQNVSVSLLRGTTRI